MSFDPRDYDGEGYERDQREFREEQERLILEEQELLEMQDAIDPDFAPECGGLAEVFGSEYIAQPVAEALAAWRKSVNAEQGGKAAA